MKQYVYSFKEGNKDMRVILGGKGANLAEMTSIGLPVPQGFTVSTEACTAYYEDGKQISPEICAQIDNKLAELEAETGKKLGDPTNPLLVSVRSGARESMPGMMDTVLNLGLNDEVATGFTKITNNERFVYDSYRRFIQMFADVVMGFPKSSFERKFDDIKEEKGVEFDTDLTAEDLKEVVAIYKEDKIERLFGHNLSDEEYLNNKTNIIYDKNEIIDITKNIINKLYYVKDKDIFKKIKDKYNNVKIIIATNHVSYVKDFIINNFNSSYLDDIIISSEIHLIKPNYDFYKYILNKYNINSDNVLFLDDNKDNIETAGEMGINTILVNKNMNIYDEICKYMIKYE